MFLLPGRHTLSALACALLCALAACTPDARSRDDGDSTPDAGPTTTPDAGSTTGTDEDHDGTPSGADCDDHDAKIHPGAAEICNGKDDDCDGQIDEPDAVDAPVWYPDTDRDGFGVNTSSVKSCDPPTGFAQAAGDCDDTQRTVHPGALEQACNGVDDDCDPSTLDDADQDHDGVTRCGGDCDDADPLRAPGKAEVCDGKDNDCNGQIDDGLTVRSYYPDQDGDGYGSALSAAQQRCGAPPAGFVLDHSDCDDTRKSVHPGASEVACNALDDDCNPATVDAPDQDGDGVSRCAGDCDDTDPARTPGKPEVCDGKDNNCNGIADDGLGSLVTYRDADGDGYGNVDDVAFGCSAGRGYVAQGGDCNDNDRTISPGAKDLCDGTDRTCDGAWTVTVPAVCPTIQSALDASLGVPRARITVASGTVSAPRTYSENLDFRGSQATLVSETGADGTILDGGGRGPVVRFHSGEGPGVVLDGFTVQNGVATVGPSSNGHTESYGGGLAVEGSSPTLKNLVVRSNQANAYYGYGAGMSLKGSNSLVQNVTVRDNTSSYYAGGILVDSGSNVTLKNVRLLNNSGSYGGGLGVYNGHVTAQNLVVAGNGGSSGGAGIFVQYGQAQITNATIYGNHGTGGAAVFATGSASATLKNVVVAGTVAANGGSTTSADSASTLVFSYSDFFANQGTAASTGTGNVTFDPRFVNVTGTSPAAWDLHLQASSQLKTAGQNADGSPTEIGAYGGPGGASW